LPHPLEIKYGLTAAELLDALNRRFRARVTLEGAVAEVHLKRKLSVLSKEGYLDKFEEHDKDDYPDFSIWLKGIAKPFLVECKNIRDEDYRQNGIVTHHRVETQKTRAAKSDPSSRYYDFTHFDILAVCLGKKTGNWADFIYAKMSDLARHQKYPHKCAVTHRVPLPSSTDLFPWYRNLRELIQSIMEQRT